MDIKNCNVKELHINFNSPVIHDNAKAPQTPVESKLMRQAIDRTFEFGQQFQLNFLLNEMSKIREYPFQAVNLSSIDFKRERIVGQVKKVI